MKDKRLRKADYDDTFTREEIKLIDKLLADALANPDKLIPIEKLFPDIYTQK